MLEYDWESSIGYWVCTTSHALRRALSTQLAQEGMTFRQWEVLAWLSANDGLSQAEMAECILPRTDTPGALDVYTHEFVDQIAQVCMLPEEELMTFAKTIGAPFELVKQVKDMGRLPVVNFAAGGIATPADAALMMRLGCDGIFVGSGVFKSSDPARCARAIVDATAHYSDAKQLVEFSRGIGEPMKGLEIAAIPERELLQARGW